MFYTIYKTTNVINNRFYIGKHQTENPYDTYLGSGIALKSAIKKYGKENFRKDILYIFDSEDEMNIMESKIVNSSLLQDPMCYNLGLGGEGGPMFVGKKHSEETKRKLSDLLTGRKLPLETRLKISDKNRQRKVSPETRRKLSEAAKAREELKRNRNLLK